MSDKIYLEPILKNFLSDEMSQMNFCMPARIEGMQNIQNGRIDVKPLHSPRFLDGSYTEMPVIRNVQLVLPSFNKSGCVFYPEQGDTVLLIFAQCNLDNFKAGAISPYTTVFERKFDLNDAIAIAGFTPFNFNNIGSKRHSKNYNVGDTSLFNNLGNGKENKINVKRNGNNEYIASSHSVKGNIVTDDDIIIGGISLKDFIHNHKHPYKDDGNPAITDPPLI